MDKHEAYTLANKLIDQHLANTGYRFLWNNRRRAAGVCSYRTKSIQLSLPLTLHSDEKDVKDTILHEIAHALAGHEAGHGFKWQQIARSIGCNGDRCYNENNKQSTYEAMKRVAKYIGVCPNGHESFKNRLPKNERSCGLCSRRFDRRYLFVYKET